ncbi:MAG: hypothetical protein ACJAWL_002961 [Motiliproteus sp.]|jgi:hypothetical protein
MNAKSVRDAMCTNLMIKSTPELFMKARHLDMNQLVRLHSWVEELIVERKTVLEERRDEKNKRELQNLIKKSGLSWQQFQDAL